MKLHLSILEKLIDLASTDAAELRMLLDDLGLEVKKIEEQNGRAVFNIETLANRGDHLYALGVAREIAARNLTQIKHPAIAPDLGEKRCAVGIKILSDKCPRYGLLDLSLPKEMRLRGEIAAVLEAEAQGERHAIVHILNYVLLELGQPMHAFDYDKIDGEIIVDLTRGREQVAALDGKSYTVPAGSLVIKDRSKIVAVAGVIGLSNSMVTPSTTRVLIESALFDPVCVRLTARAMGISTDASYTFERGADREAIVTGLKRVVHLCSGAGGAVKEAEGAHVLGYTVVDKFVPEKRRVSVTLSRMRKEMELPRLEEQVITSRLKHLGYQIEVQPHGKNDREITVSVPSWRLWDVSNSDDLVEDFARSHGLDKVKLTLPPLDYDVPELNPVEAIMQRIEPALVGSGFCEVMTKAFYAASDVQLLEQYAPGVTKEHLAIRNSLERSYSHMKATNLLHLARLCESNHRRGVLSCKVFELGKLFQAERREGAQYEYEREVLTLAVSGRWGTAEFRRGERTEELLSLTKGVVGAVFSSLNQKPTYEGSETPFLHPGMQAEIRLGRRRLGCLGVLHPGLKAALELKHDLIYAQIELEPLLGLETRRELVEPVDLPAIKRDITLKLPARLFAATIAQGISGLSQEILEQVSIIDDFKKAEEDFRRTTFRLTFRAATRTLEHGEVDLAMQTILADLERKQLFLA